MYKLYEKMKSYSLVQFGIGGCQAKWSKSEKQKANTEDLIYMIYKKYK